MTDTEIERSKKTRDVTGSGRTEASEFAVSHRPIGVHPTWWFMIRNATLAGEGPLLDFESFQ